MGPEELKSTHESHSRNEFLSMKHRKTYEKIFQAFHNLLPSSFAASSSNSFNHSEWAPCQRAFRSWLVYLIITYSVSLSWFAFFSREGSLNNHNPLYISSILLLHTQEYFILILFITAIVFVPVLHGHKLLGHFLPKYQEPHKVQTKGSKDFIDISLHRTQATQNATIKHM